MMYQIQIMFRPLSSPALVSRAQYLPDLTYSNPSASEQASFLNYLILTERFSQRQVSSDQSDFCDVFRRNTPHKTTDYLRSRLHQL